MISVFISPDARLKLDRLAKAIRDASDKELDKELVAGFRRAVKPMTKDFKRGALQILPYRGGLAEWVAQGMRFRTNIGVGKRKPRLKISASLPGHDLNAINQGRVRHPTFGHRDAPRWVTQTIRPGFWDDAGTLAAQDARDEIVKAIDIVAAKLEARA